MSYLRRLKGKKYMYIGTITKQLRLAGLPVQFFTLVKIDAFTLKISNGKKGAIIKYDYARDTYEVQGYNGMDVEENLTDVYADMLPEIVAEKLHTHLIKIR